MNSIYDILNKLNSIQPATETSEVPSVKQKSKLQESIDTVSEKYMGFKKVAAAAKAGGAKDPDAVAAAIGRKKYGKEKFQKAAATGKKLGEEQGSKRLSIGQQMARDGITYSVEREKELIGIIGDYLAKNGHSEKAIRYYLSYDEDFVPDTLSELPKEGVAEGSGDKSFEDMNRAELLDYLNMSPKEAADMSNKDLRDACEEKTKDVSEVAPPGAKAERMVKHIKKGYAKDGKLTKVEKAKAYGRAWKAHKAGKVEEAVASLKPLLDAGMTAKQISEGWEDMMKAVKKQHKDQVGTGKFDKKKVSTGTVYTRKYDADGMSNTDDEVKADGEKRGRGRPKKSAFESSIDRLTAEVYGDLLAEGSPYAYRPSGSDIAGPGKNTLGSQLKGLGRDLINKIAPDDETLLKDLEKKTVGEANAPIDYDKVLEAIAALYGDDMWENDAMQDLANDLEQARPTDQELDFIIANGKLPKRLANIQFTAGDDVQFGEAKVKEDDGEELSYEQEQLRQSIGDDMFDAVKLAVEQSAEIPEDIYDALYDYYTESGEMPYGTAKARDGDPVEWIQERLGQLFDKMTEEHNMDKELAEMMRLAGMQVNEEKCKICGMDPCACDHDHVKEDDMEEGNEFSGALAKAKAAGAKEFEVDGKKYQVKEDEEQIDECGMEPTSMPMGELTISGSPEALAAMLKLAGLQAPAMMEQPVEEEKDPRYEANTTPEEEVMPVQAQIKGGNGEVAGMEKAMHKDGAARFSDNPLAMKESIDDLSEMGRDLMKAYESIKIQK